MTVFEFFENPNQFVLWLSAFYIGGYVFVLQRSWQLGNKQEAQKSAIYGIAQKFDEKELIDVIENIINEEPRILMPVKKNWILSLISFLFLVAAFFSAFFEQLAILFPIFLNYGLVPYSLFFVFFIFGLILLGFQYKYLVTIAHFKDQHSQKGNKKIRVVVDKIDAS